uniref:Uncharacterized protein n=1 Tax=Cannabis sativa TaxID=3483 RepID=A0A803P5K8_CANSA
MSTINDTFSTNSEEYATPPLDFNGDGFNESFTEIKVENLDDDQHVEQSHHTVELSPNVHITFAQMYTKFDGVQSRISEIGKDMFDYILNTNEAMDHYFLSEQQKLEIKEKWLLEKEILMEEGKCMLIEKENMLMEKEKMLKDKEKMILENESKLDDKNNVLQSIGKEVVEDED